MKVVNPMIYPTKQFIMSKIKEELDLREYTIINAVIKDYKKDFDKSDHVHINHNHVHPFYLYIP